MLSTTTTSTDPLQRRFGTSHRLPRALRLEAEGMEWELFSTIYCPTPDIRISQLQGHGPRTERLGAERLGAEEFGAELLITSKTQPPQHRHHTVRAHGAVSACSQILAAHGRYVEVRSFHQMDIFEATCTIVQVSHQYLPRSAWACGFGSTPENSIAAAMSSAAQRIHG
ncbi:acetyl-CoA acetyltransferase [Corynebacterium uropygiale]|uniref:Acetyl-CoA acetyltransferase n=1 Tax=Corynebacterium uropygiale TaxID=1775911 RepID=A0A9X1QRU8_9CORY|nr:acetyl-CoA acetyltransferase [Corynebacterium uropygiale]MCF4007232.1 acetyl-CoA acetyltransferase [Corynebacterium uropygiale]